MNIAEIIERRDCGLFRIGFTQQFNYPINSTLSDFGLYTEQEKLIEVSAEIAVQIVETILWRDLAYTSEIMPRENARQYAEYLIYQMAPAEPTFYSNAEWHRYRQSGSFSWNSFTHSTFDAGILCIGRDSSMCIWVEDED